MSSAKTKGQLEAEIATAITQFDRERPDGTYLMDAQDLLEELSGMAENRGWGSKLIEILALRALALQAAGDTDQAMTPLERALTLAGPEGFVRTFSVSAAACRQSAGREP